MHSTRSTTLMAVIVLTMTISAGAQRGAWNGEWRSHGGDDGHIQYAALDQVNEDNLEDLDIVWRWSSVDMELRQRHDELQAPSARVFFHEVTPLKIGDGLYVSTSLGQIAEIDPGTGETRWSVDPEVWRTGRPANLGFLSKGLAYWTDGDAERLFYAGGAEATLVSVDPARRALDTDFGDGGKVDLTRNLGAHVARDTYTLTSAPLVAGDVVIVGSSIRDTPLVGENPPGHVRAYDVRSGELRWTFNTIPNESDYGSQTWEAESWRDAGAVNVWTLMSVDPDLGYVYLPVGSEAHNWYGGHRPGDNLFAQSLVCIDAATGERVWHFQLVHHGLWDWDPPAAPTLIDIEVAGQQIKAVAQVTKQGFLFVLDRITGEPVWPIEERPVPQSTVPGEVTSATQPFPTRPAPFEWQGISEDILIDFTPELHAEALRIMREQDGGQLYSPPSETGTIVNPGWAGGGNWTGASFDPDTQVLYVPSFTDWNLVQLRRPGTDDDLSGEPFDYVWNGDNTPRVQGLPLFKPPYGRITAIDMRTGEHRWQIANGDGPRQAEPIKHLNLPPLGTNAMNFPISTKTLLFTATGRDAWNPPLLNVYNKRTGELLRAIELPSAVRALPMTYMHEDAQYVVVAIGSGREPDEIVALALR